MQKKSLVILVVILLVGGGFLLINKYSKPEASQFTASLQSSVKEITFYYLPTCSWCQKVEKEGTLEKIGQLGIKVNKINAAIGPIRHKFEAVPTFVIDGKVYSGYKTFEQIKELLGYPKENNPTDNQTSFNPQQNSINFLGEKGQNVILESGEVKLSTSIFNDNKARFYNVKMPDSKTIYFFVIKDKNGIYRAAANACVVCFKTYKGFRQEGDEIVCNNCGNRYPVEKIATEKGGCNPGPINPNLEVKNGTVIIKQVDIEEVSELF